MFKIIFQLVERNPKSQRITKFETKEVKGTYNMEKAYLIREKLAKRKDVHAAIITKANTDMSHLKTTLI